MKRTCAITLVLVLTMSACVQQDESTPSTLAPTTTTTSDASTTAPPTESWTIPTGLEVDTFGDFELTAVGPSSTYGGPELPETLEEVVIPESLEAHLDDPRVRELLIDNGFVVVPAEAEHFWQIYEGAGYAVAPVFVTTDAAYHTWHLVFDKILRESEQQVFLPLLEEMLSGLVERSRAQASQYAGTPLEEATSRAAQFYEAAATVLDLDIGDIGELAEDEVALVMEAT